MINKNNQRAKSPMHVILNEVHSGINTANGVLSRLWRIILRDKNIHGHQWERLVSKWSEKGVEILGKDTASVKKGNTIRSLAESNMTWKVFMQGLQILNASNRYKCIRFEVHFVHHKDNKSDIIGVNVIERNNRISGDDVDDEYKELRPEHTAVPGEVYRLRGFVNSRINECLVRCISSLPLSITANTFDGYSIVGTLLMDADGMESLDWAVAKIV